MKWSRNVECMGKGRGVYRFWWKHLREIVHLGDPGIDGRIILKWIFRKWKVVVWSRSGWIRIGKVATLVDVLMC
jgi:hypothetical protein